MGFGASLTGMGLRVDFFLCFKGAGVCFYIGVILFC